MAAGRSLPSSPPVLRWGPVGWLLYLRLFISGVPAQLGELEINLIFAVLGVE